jgi:hypothetical protein
MYAALFHRPAPCSRTRSGVLKPILIKKRSNLFETSSGVAAGPINAAAFWTPLKVIVGFENIIRHPAPDRIFVSVNDQRVALQTSGKWLCVGGFYVQFPHNLIQLLFQVVRFNKNKFARCQRFFESLGPCQKDPIIFQCIHKAFSRYFGSIQGIKTKQTQPLRQSAQCLFGCKAQIPHKKFPAPVLAHHKDRS